MPKQVLTSAVAYATPEELLVHYDVRRVGDLVSVNGTRAMSSEIILNETVLEGLKWGSSRIEMASLVGKKYLPEDLNALIDNGGVGASLLTGLVCDLAFWFCLKFRYPGIDQTETYKDAMESLQLLRFGERIFSFEENADHNKADHRRYSQQDYNRLTLTTSVARNYFGIRGRSIKAARGF